MHFLYLKRFLSSLLLFSATFADAGTGLFFSEYIEGSSNNKAIELYNASPESINLSQKGIVLQVYSNGASSPTNTILLAGHVSSGNTYVITHSSFTLNVPAGSVQQTSSGLNFNGNDAVVLRSGGASGRILDIFGQIGQDPGLEWKSAVVRTSNVTLRRKPGIFAGDTLVKTVFDPSTEWMQFGTDDVSDLGKHSIRKIKYSLSPPELIFFASAGIMSSSKKINILISDTIKSLGISISNNFKISRDSLSGFGNRIDNLAEIYPGKNFIVYVRYFPVSGYIHEGFITFHFPENSDTEYKVKGLVTGPAPIPVSVIQSDAAITPYKGVNVTVQGIVTKDLQKTHEQKGFFLQDLEPDSLNTTSEGIFVHDALNPVEVGDIIRVQGTADEVYHQTVINHVSSVNLIKKNAALPDPVIITLPLDSAGAFEKYEGMLVQFKQPMAVSDVHNLGRYGEVLLAVNAPLQTPTNFIDPNDAGPGFNYSGLSNVRSVLKQIELNNRSKIILADDLSAEYPNPVPFTDSITKTLRVGSVITTLTGVISYDFGNYRIYPLHSPEILYAKRPPVPDVGRANVKIAALNVLNFFNGNGTGGGFPTSRGAKSPAELKRQKSKLTAAIKRLDADVIGLMEIENDGDGPYSAIKELVESVNAGQHSDNIYAYIKDAEASGNPGTDEIKVGMLYKPSKVKPHGIASYSNSSSFTTLGRPPLAQTFSLLPDKEKFTVIVNHFKSKSCGTARNSDADQLDGQSCFNSTRLKQAEELISFTNDVISAGQVSDIVMIGDFNAYTEEDPLDRLRAEGFADLIPNSYSYIFDGQSGSLDHVFASPSLAAKVTRAAKWHINAAEPGILDYTLTAKKQNLFAEDPYRSSDHDPVLAGFFLQNNAVNGLPIHSGGPVPVHPNPVKRGEVLTYNSSHRPVLINSFGTKVHTTAENGLIHTSDLLPGIYLMVTEKQVPCKIIVTE